MTEPAVKLEEPTAAKVKQAIAKQPPRLDERLYIGRYTFATKLQEHAAVIRKCGLTAEIEVEEGKEPILWATRRRNRYGR